MPVLSPDGTAACECGARWVLKTPHPWGTRMKCTNMHEKDFPNEVTPRTNAVELLGGRGGYPDEMASAPDPLMLRLRLWWWRRTRRGGERSG